VTNEEAIEILKDCELNPCVPKDKEAVNMAIKALKQEIILNKIRAEIEDLDIFYDNDYFSSNRDAMFKCSDVLQIIDKYKSEE
jgi:hypothetical protein